VHGDETGDRAIGGIAARQHGVVTRAQLLSAGLGRGGIAHRLAERRLHRLDRGVFLVGHAVAPPLAHEMAAVLACAAGLPPDGVNVRVERYEVDFLWRAAGVIVEVDGYAYHSTRAAFERDRIRDAELQAAGYQVTRVTWRQLIETSEAVVALIAKALASSARR